MSTIKMYRISEWMSLETLLKGLPVIVGIFNGIWFYFLKYSAGNGVIGIETYSKRKRKRKVMQNPANIFLIKSRKSVLKKKLYVVDKNNT